MFVVLSLWFVLSGATSIDVNGTCNSDLRPFRSWNDGALNLNARTTLTCKEYNTSFCSKIPSHLSNPENYVGSPYSLDVRGYLRQYKNKMYGGFNITWEIPAHAGGINLLTGFLLEIQMIAGPPYKYLPDGYSCRVFDLSENNFTSSDVTNRLQFNKEYWTLPGGPDRVYMIILYALPRAPSPHYLQIRQTMFASIPARNIGDVYPSYWTATIRYINDSVAKNIVTMFEPAPQRMNFRSYRIDLVNQNNLDQPHAKKIIPRYDLADNSTIRVEFKGVQPGKYQVWIQPEDDFFNDEEKCVCHYKEPPANRLCKQCVITKTAWFLIGVPPETTTTQSGLNSTSKVPVGPTSETSVGASTLEQNYAVQIVGAVGGTLLGVFLIMIVIIYFRRIVFKGNKNHIPTESPEEKSCTNNGVYRITSGITETGDTCPCLKIKKIFLISADDHEYHKKVVECLAKYLQHHCKCHVFYAPWYLKEIHAQSSFLWTTNFMDKADYILVINSEAAFNLFQAQKEKKCLEPPDVRPEGDLFSPAIHQLLAKLRKVLPFDKIVMTSFEYTRKDFIITEFDNGWLYKLPKHLSEMLCHIHHLEPHKINPRQVDLPIGDNQPTSAESLQLKEAITKASAYEKANPEWFNGRFLSRADSGVESISLDSQTEMAHEHIPNDDGADCNPFQYNIPEPWHPMRDSDNFVHPDFRSDHYSKYTPEDNNGSPRSFLNDTYHRPHPVMDCRSFVAPSDLNSVYTYDPKVCSNHYGCSDSDDKMDNTSFHLSEDGDIDQKLRQINEQSQIEEEEDYIANGTLHYVPCPETNSLGGMSV